MTNNPPPVILSVPFVILSVPFVILSIPSCHSEHPLLSF